MQCVIMVFPDHTHFPFLNMKLSLIFFFSFQELIQYLMEKKLEKSGNIFFYFWLTKFDD